MTLIIGLGNPGEKYAHTRHNIGFRVVDRIREDQRGEEWRHEKKFHADVSKAGAFMLLKPQEYMNLSGKTAGEFTRFYTITAEDVVVVQDDLSIAFGMLRYRLKGSSGGHKGVSSMEEELGTNAFRRFKVGIGPKKPPEIPAEDFVLQKFSREEEKKLVALIPAVAQNILTILADPTHGPETLNLT